METPPTVGRMVHYRLPEGMNTGEVRPAIIVRVFVTGLVSLAVFLDGNNDGLSEIVSWKQNVKKGRENGQWDWMPFQKDQMSRLAPGTVNDSHAGVTLGSLPANTKPMNDETVAAPVEEVATPAPVEEAVVAEEKEEAATE